MKVFDYAIPLNKLESSTARVLIMGPSGSGKTTSALTFPNPLVANFDNKLADHRHRADVQVLPFHSKSFLEDLNKKESLGINVMLAGQLNSAFIFNEWLKKNVEVIPADMTLIIDSGTMLITALDIILKATDKVDKDGEPVNGHAMWRRKLIYVDELMAHFKKLKCKLVWIAHESMTQNNNGETNGKFNPLISGASKDNFFGQFTHKFRQTVEVNKTTNKMEFSWQIGQTKLCDCFCPLPENKKERVIANYNNITW